MGKHQLMRLVDLLTVHECEELLLALSQPEENIFNQLQRLSEENNRLPFRRPRDLGIQLLSLMFNTCVTDKIHEPSFLLIIIILYS